MAQAARSSTSMASQAPVALPQTSAAGLSVVGVQQIFKKVCPQCHQNEAKFDCSRCKMVSYCGKECQKRAWSAHKSACFFFDKLTAPLPADSEVVCEYVGRDGVMVPLTQKAFQEKTGAYFAPYFHVSSDTFSRWKELFSDCSTLETDLLTSAAIEYFKKSPPKLALKEEPLFGGVGIVAQETIKVGEIVCLYVGQIVMPKGPKSFKSTLYTMENVDGSLKAGLGVFINDGPPNCIYVFLKNYEGIPQVPALIAATTIKAGDTLWAPYGNEHPLYSAAYTIDPGKYREISQYCKTGKFYHPKSSTTQEMAYFSYILLTRSLFLRLLLDGSLDLAKTRNAIEKFVGTERPPIFIEQIQPFLQLAKHLLSFEEDAINQAVIDRLLTGVRTDSLGRIIDDLKKDRLLTVEKIGDYGTLVKMIDQLHLIAHRSLISTYIGRSDEKEMPPFDPAQIMSLFFQLPSSLKRVFTEHLRISHTMFLEKGWRHAHEISGFILDQIMEAILNQSFLSPSGNGSSLRNEL